MSRINKLVAGIGWGGISTAATACFQLVFMAVMARLLDPVDFGLVAIASVMLRFLTYFAQLGVGPALIQKGELTGGDVPAATSISLGISSVCTAVALVFAPVAADFFSMPTLTAVIRALSLNFLLNGLSVISLSLLRRDMRFRDIAIIELSAYLFGYCLVGIAMACFGFAVWALVGAVLSQSAFSAILGYLFSRHEIGWRHERHQRAHFFNFGARYSVIGFVEFLSGSLDSLIIGKFIGTAAAGIYGRASALASLPVQQPANVLTRALFPVLSRVSPQRQIANLQVTVLLLGSYAFAVCMGVVAAASDLVGVLLGPKWIEAVPIVQVLAFAVAPQYLSHLVGVTLDAMGELRAKLRIQTGVLAVQCAAFGLLFQYGMLGIASAVVLAEWMRLLLMAGFIVRLLRPGLGEFRLILSVVLSAGLVAFGFVWFAGHAMPTSLPRSLHLLLEIVAGAAALSAVAWASRSMIGRLPVMNELAERLPHVRRFIPSSNLQES